MTAPKPLRCAIYTRKSTEEGLDQEYNSLHAQRDACEAYIRSQAGEGWTALPTAYDDGGISGGTMERPGLKQLLADIAARKVDVVVVYKVDRLTRSLGDFSKIVDVFDKNGVAFVSVTQSFNTTSSMGRLTLNMLLSFAQFEREVTGERIRDKIAASKKKGMWMGGNLPLGYDADGRTLKINEAEAETVRHIFKRYLELRSVHRLVEELEAEGIRSKRRETKAGGEIGGEVFSRGALFHLLSNRTYLGLITHKKEAYPGQHTAIVDQETFDAAQALMAENSIKRTTGSARRTQSLLMGKLFDADGRPMTPTFAKGKGGKRYRYYVSSTLQNGTARADGRKTNRLPGPTLDRMIETLRQRLFEEHLPEVQRVMVRLRGLAVIFAPVDTPEAGCHATDLEPIRDRLAAGERVWVAPSGSTVVITRMNLERRGGRVLIEGPVSAPRRVDRSLVSALRKAHSLAVAAKVSPLTSPAENIRSRGFASQYEDKISRLAFLAPDLQLAILDGAQPAYLTLDRLLTRSLPASWSDQRTWRWAR